MTLAEAGDPEVLRRVEAEVDEGYREARLMSRPRPSAAFHLLGGAELRLIAHRLQQPAPQILSVYQDTQLFALRHALHWVMTGTAEQGLGRLDWEDEGLVEAKELLELAIEYDRFAIAFPYWHRGVVDLRLEGGDLRAEHRLADETRYEAYNRLIVSAEPQLPLPELAGVMALAARERRTDRGRLSIPLNGRSLIAARDSLRPVFEAAFHLPAAWQFGRYSLAEFRDVAVALRAYSFVWSAAWAQSINELSHRGAPDAVSVLRRRDLTRMVSAVSGLPTARVTPILEDLTYSARGIRMPDPALQPIVPLSRRDVVIAPHLFLGVNAERNLSALLNQIPEERGVYSRLVDEKERTLRERMVEDLRDQGPWRFWTGPVPGRPDLPDIDLAIIDHAARICLMIEIKWFIDPAEPREIVMRHEELQKGIRQAEALHAAFRAEPELLDAIGIDSTFRLEYVVGSANWVGLGVIQHPDVPIIQTRHLVRQIIETKDLAGVADWLRARAYLPSEGVHYRTRPTTSIVAGYTLHWYGIKPLVENYLA